MIETVISIIILIPIVATFGAITVMLVYTILGPLISKIKDYLHKKRLAGRTATQKFKDLGNEKATDGVYYKFKKVPIKTIHYANGKPYCTTVDEKEEVDKRIVFYDDKTVVLMYEGCESPFPMTLEELDAISTRVIELGWLKNGSN